jgi:predicted nucleic acid-binding protein
LSRIRKLAAPYPLLWPSKHYCQHALELFAQFSLSHHLDFADAFIAATALEYGATLCTFNVKHFAAVPGLVTEQPYVRV